MATKQIAAFALIAGVTTVGVISQLRADNNPQPVAPASQIGRYQIVKIPNTITMVDTATGETWELQNEKWVDLGSPIGNKH